MACSSASSLTGFCKKSTAPFFIASTLIGTSPCPVKKTTGREMLRAAIKSRSCVPVMPGMRTSRITQPVPEKAGRARNSAAEANTSPCHPAERTNHNRPFLADGSSSTMKTVMGDEGRGVADGLFAIGGRLLSQRLAVGGTWNGQREIERRAPVRVVRKPQPPTVGFNDRPRDRQTDPHSLLLSRPERFEQLLPVPLGDARSGIAQRKQGLTGFCPRQGQLQVPLLGGLVLHGFQGVHDEVEENLLDLPFVSHHGQLRLQVLGGLDLPAD